MDEEVLLNLNVNYLYEKKIPTFLKINHQKITSYGDKFTYILKEEMKELDKISCDIYNNVDKAIYDDIMFFTLETIIFNIILLIELLI